MNDFNVKEVTKNLIDWIKSWFDKNGDGCNAVIGISGGLDSSVVAALCEKALGKERVIGVLMPNGEQRDICFSDMLCDYLDIKRYEVNINDMYNELTTHMSIAGVKPSKQTITNISPRLRMTTLFAMAQSLNGRISCNSNLSEAYIGYFTIGGDNVGGFAPLLNLTKTEVKLIAKELGLPEMLVKKKPSDGLCGKTDEDAFGFTYDVLDKYIRTGICEDEEIKNKIDSMHEKNLFKLQPMPSFQL